MGYRRVLVVASAVLLCLLGTGGAPASAAGDGTAPVLLRASTSAPTLGALRRHRHHARPSTRHRHRRHQPRRRPPVRPLAPTPPAATPPASPPSQPAQPADATPASDTSTATVTVAIAYAQRIVELVNDQRAAAGLPALRVSGCAQGYAASWSQHMADSGEFAHQALAPIESACAATGAGENIVAGASTPEQAMDLWMASDGHRANILRSTFTDIGVGAAQAADGRWYATQDFLTR